MQFLHRPRHFGSRLTVVELANVGIKDVRTSALSKQECTSKPNSHNQHSSCSDLTRRRGLLELAISLLLPLGAR